MDEFQCKKCMDTAYIDLGGYGPDDPARVEPCPACERGRSVSRRRLVEKSAPSNEVDRLLSAP